MKTVIQVEDVVTKFGERTIHDGINLHIDENEIYAILGQSGSGKSVLMKEMIMLLEPSEGEVTVLGKSLESIGFKEAQELRSDWGVLFQFGALYSSLTVAENIEVQLKEYTNISKEMRDKLVQSKLELVGLQPDVGTLYPSELSGGMVKRAALARALAMEPKLLFLDEPTSALDVVSGQFIVEAIQRKRDAGHAVLFSTHIMSEAEKLCDRIAIIHDGCIRATGTLEELRASTGEHYLEDIFRQVVQEPAE